MRYLCCYLLLLMGYAVAAQSTTTITLQPDPEQGKDAVVWSNNPDFNHGNVESNTIYTWTNGGKLGNKRAFIQFDLSVIPENSFIVSAYLSLYYNPTDPYEGFADHTGPNDLLIRRVLTSWEENTITWNNQPPATADNEVVLPPSSSPKQDYLDMDVTLLIRDMLNPKLEGDHGFLLRMQDEQNIYRGLIFASSDHMNENLRPLLVVTYEEVQCETFTISPQVGTDGQNAVISGGGKMAQQDAVVWSNNPDFNHGDVESNTIYTWTNNGILGNKRSFLQFDLSSVPENSVVKSAGLSLFYNPTDPYEGFDDHQGTNDLLIQRVLSAWEESTITWNNQPAATDSNEVTILPSTSATQDYLAMDVSILVSDMLNPSLQGNHGFLLKMLDEEHVYRGLIFASGDHADPALHPALEVCWTETVPTALRQRESSNLAFEVYPNPGQGQLRIKFPGLIPGQYTLSVFDQQGKEITDVNLNDDLIELKEKGIFFVRIVDTTGNWGIKKIVVQ